MIPTSSACTSGSQAIGYAWEAIRHGYQTVMVAGGAEELCPSEAAVFDTLLPPASTMMRRKPHLHRLDENRDGLVIGEGAGTLILEELEHAKARARPFTVKSSALRLTATRHILPSHSAKPCSIVWSNR